MGEEQRDAVVGLWEQAMAAGMDLVAALTAVKVRWISRWAGCCVCRASQTCAVWQARLTAEQGALWHMVACKGGDMAVAVSAEQGTLMDVKVRGCRIAAWKHSLEVCCVRVVAHVVREPLDGVAVACQ